MNKKSNKEHHAALLADMSVFTNYKYQNNFKEMARNLLVGP